MTAYFRMHNCVNIHIRADIDRQSETERNKTKYNSIMKTQRKNCSIQKDRNKMDIMKPGKKTRHKEGTTQINKQEEHE